jgi:hypothetical protein
MWEELTGRMINTKILKPELISSPAAMVDTWFNSELRLLRELTDKLKLDSQTLRQMINELSSMQKAIENDCSVIELVILQAQRDRSLKTYLNRYNAEFGSSRVVDDNATDKL